MATVPRPALGKIIHVQIRGTQVIPTHVPIRKSRGEEVEWHSDTARSIKFAKSPFSKDEFHVAANGSVRSGPAKKEAETCPDCTQTPATNHPKGHHDYDIVELKGPVVVDPQIIILD